MRHPKHTARPQWAEFGERRFYARSRAELRYAGTLEILRLGRQIVDWRHEPEKFLFPDRKTAPVFYLPDFRVTFPDGRVEYHETKGWWDRGSVERLRLMAKHYPEVVVRIVGAQLDPKDIKRIERARAAGREAIAKHERMEARAARGKVGR